MAMRLLKLIGLAAIYAIAGDIRILEVMSEVWSPDQGKVT